MTQSTEYRNLFVGLDQQVPLLDGSSRQYINLDNAASTPSMLPVKETIDRFLPYYSSVHRGTGFKSQLSTWAYDNSRQVILDFVGADPKTYTVIFGKNTTEAVNKLVKAPPGGIAVSPAKPAAKRKAPARVAGKAAKRAPK